MGRTTFAALMLGVALAGVTVPAIADPVTITLGSWRTEDLAVWQDKILPVFMAAHPDIKVEFAPINTNEYNAAIQSQIEGGAGPDLITCRPFDVNNEWIGRGYFIKLDGLPGLDNLHRYGQGRVVNQRLDLLRAGRRRAGGLLLQRRHFQRARPQGADHQRRVHRRAAEDQGQRQVCAAGRRHLRVLAACLQRPLFHRPRLLAWRGRPSWPDRWHQEADRSRFRGRLQSLCRLEAVPARRPTKPWAMPT